MHKGFHIISQTQNGKLFTCDYCGKIHLEYNNLFFSFTGEEFERFKEFFSYLDGTYWEEQNEHSPCTRKIKVPIEHHNLVMLFNSREIDELKQLLGKKENRFNHLTSSEFSWQLSSN